MKTVSRCLGLGSVLAFALAALPTFGSTIFWGSVYQDTFLSSTGAPLGSNFRFEIGTFDLSGGWAPTSANLGEWEARWRVFDAAFEGPEWQADNQFVNASVEHTALGGSSSLDADPADVFAEGALAYLWVYNSKAITETSEWALLMDADTSAPAYTPWAFPDPADISGSFDWQMVDLDTAIYGSTNIGARDVSNQYVDPGSYTLQTQAVPEPGAVLMVMLAGGLLLPFRRFRPQHNL